MNKLVLLTLLIGATIVLGSCYPFGADGTWDKEEKPPAPMTPTGSSPTVSTANGTDAVIIIDVNGFNPTTLIVNKGTTVTWNNKSTVGHRVIADREEFASGNFGPGASFAWTFNQSGNSTYHCSNHPSLKGTVTVK